MPSGAERASDDKRNVCGVGCGTERNMNYFTKITVHLGTRGACASKQNESQTVLADQVQRYSKTTTNMLVVNLNLIHAVEDQE
jgi:hypothetical protein